MSKKETVTILGASDKQDRYSYKAMTLLEEYGHTTILIHPRIKDIEGRKCFNSIDDIIIPDGGIDTLTMYVNPTISSKSISSIIKLNPKRVIFNPGTENPELMEQLKNSKIAYEEACTLVLLNTNQY